MIKLSTKTESLYKSKVQSKIRSRTTSSSRPMEEATTLKLGQKTHGKSSLDQDGKLVNNGKWFIELTKFSLTGS